MSYTATFSTKRTDTSAGPTGSQSRLALDFFLGLRGRDDPGHERHAAFWTDLSSNPDLATYKSYAQGLLIPLHLNTLANPAGTSFAAAAYFLKGNGSATRLTPAAAVSWANVPGTTYGWTVTKNGSTVGVRQGSSPGLQASWTSPFIASYADKGAFGFLVSAGRAVEVTDFHVPTASPVPSLGGLLAGYGTPGRFPSTSLTYGFPDTGFNYTRFSDIQITGYAPLASNWTPASDAMKGGFRRGAAAWQTATGNLITLTEASPDTADILIQCTGEFPGINGYNGYGFPPPNGGIFIRPVISTTNPWGPGTYADQLAIHEMGHAIFGLRHPPPGSVIDDYSLTVMVLNSLDEERWWTTPRRADIDAALMNYDAANAP